MKMVHCTIKFIVSKRTCTVSVPCIKLFTRNYVQNVMPGESEKNRIHPYKQMHPWKSLTEFSEDIFRNVIYNKDGLVAINKPYGIKRQGVARAAYGVVNAADYTLQDAIPYISEQLQYPNLTIVRCPEKYMSGIALLAADLHMQHAIAVSAIRTNYLSNTFWIITTGIPNSLEGEHRLAMKLNSHPHHKKNKAVIITSWSRNDEKLRRIKLLNVKFQVLSNSTLNLCTLVELKISTMRWHAIRLFAATFVYAPILGDNLCGSRIQKVGNTYVQVNPFFDYVNLPPKLDKRILNLLNVTTAQQNIIPSHIHLRSVFLPYIFNETLTIEAPLPPYFDWTCKQLEFKCFM